jgi:hypothetical protein
MASITDAGTAAMIEYLILVLRGLGRFWEHHTGIVGVVDGSPHAHYAQVVLKLFAAIQADHITLAVRLACLGDRGHGPGKGGGGRNGT